MSARVFHAEQPDSFAFTDEYLQRAKEHIAKYPPGRQQSALLPLFHLVQEQIDGTWLPRAAMDYVADMLEIPRIKAYEVATFYTMYNLAPVGRHCIEVCTTTPCWLKGSADIVDACQKRLGIRLGETTPDMMFTLREVECLGACVNAPMMQMGPDFYEDLTPQNVVAIINDVYAGRTPKAGSQTRPYGSMNAAGTTTLVEEAKVCGVPVCQGTG